MVDSSYHLVNVDRLTSRIPNQVRHQCRFLARPTPICDDCTNSRWRFFKGCLRALDGIDVRVSEQDKGKYRTRKGHVIVNVLGIRNPNMQFIYVLSDWEGSAMDNRVLLDSLNRRNGLRVPTDNYYLCGNGYSNAEGFLTPYRRVRYHLCEWYHRAGGPQNSEEYFNLKHSSTRNAIQRAFGELCTNNWPSTESDMTPTDEEGTSRQRRRGASKEKTLTRCTWTVREEEVLINGLRSFVASGWKCNNGFCTSYLAQLENFMLRAIPNCDIRAEPHIKSKI
ncbi:hypothetical protein Sango_2092700 [Sesamum angolense]|uniref:DDE Tnp4 domain-containing protein n=1 Tax=Sesamum angolense TaxID=2727404 RepID=A0AAE1WBG0_9LAMI|nr:hypothetical protein Sango_2092700 [Sesamum angolense]